MMRMKKEIKRMAGTLKSFAAWRANRQYPIEALLDLMESIDIDTSTDDGESYTVIGNVDTATLKALGFEIPKD